MILCFSLQEKLSLVKKILAEPHLCIFAVFDGMASLDKIRGWRTHLGDQLQMFARDLVKENQGDWRFNLIPGCVHTLPTAPSGWVKCRLPISPCCTLDVMWDSSWNQASLISEKKKKERVMFFLLSDDLQHHFPSTQTPKRANAVNAQVY